MPVVELDDGRRVFAPPGSEPDAVRCHIIEQETPDDNRADRRESASALSYTDKRKSVNGLAALVQEHLKKDTISSHSFAFRSKKANTLKIRYWDGNGLCCSARGSIKGAHLAKNERSRRHGDAVSAHSLPC
ncbi:IS66 family insertion sequence element accessory protein TnpB [Bradyrhizobium sp. GCM10023182]|uniref:IS66 family insertion sequence element accessory protein TnpB n=1 Tax=Bradyrhizobium zhengyangense TaxID=2911009 RepID=A0ABS9M0M2_9BRAD|nr:IS66 family insertion sequence element accessory protein TnpB [Bradyrhizobium zhengyangense]MCG2672827.1 IS66 family insertion sequence element accessory protein TnpB [Bradyrhizobium zhengyangense]